MYLWFEEMGLINEPKQSRKDQIAEFKEKMQTIIRRNKLTRHVSNDNLALRGKAV